MAFEIKNGILEKYIPEVGETEVVIPDGVRSIGRRAFYECVGLTSITISKGVTKIGDSAFEGCKSLKNIAIPKSVTEIGFYAFRNCTSLTSINIPGSVTNMSYHAFGGCAGLTSINIPSSVTYIGKGAFESCTGLTSITVDKNNPVYRSENNCCIENSSSTLVFGCQNSIIPNSVKNIGEGAFSGCTGLTSITIPNSVTKIRDGAFCGCSALESVIIPDNITNIDWYAFNYSTYIISYVLRGEIAIGEGVFIGCSNLKFFQGNGIKSAANTMFKYLSPDCAVVFPAYDQTKGFFGGIYTLRGYLAKPELFDEKQAAAYGKYLAAQRKKVMPEFLNKDRVDALILLTKHAKISVENFSEFFEIAQAANAKECIAFLLDWKDKNIAPDAEERAIMLDLMRDPTSAIEMQKIWSFKTGEDGGKVITKYKGPETDIIIPSVIAKKAVTGIGDSAFRKREEIKSITFPETLASIGARAFEGCTGLKSINIPGSVTSIDWEAFKDCTKLKNITISEGVTKIGNSAFEGCKSLKNIAIPDSVTSIGWNAFKGCKGFTSINIPGSVTEIRRDAFTGCTGVESITVDTNNMAYRSENNCCIEISTGTLVFGCKNSIIPDSVTSIGNSAFFYCTGLTSVTIPDSVTEIGSDAFYSCPAIIIVSWGSYAARYVKEHEIPFVIK